MNACSFHMATDILQYKASEYTFQSHPVIMSSQNYYGRSRKVHLVRENPLQFFSLPCDKWCQRSGFFGNSFDYRTLRSSLTAFGTICKLLPLLFCHYPVPSCCCSLSLHSSREDSMLLLERRRLLLLVLQLQKEHSSSILHYLSVICFGKVHKCRLP